MTEKALNAGAEAFKRGLKRDANPYDASAEEWMCWRDGWEQAKAVSARPVPFDQPASEPARG